MTRFAALSFAINAGMLLAQTPTEFYPLTNHFPGSGLTQLPNGNFIGATGTWIFTPDSLPDRIFEVTPAGAFGVLASFPTNGSQGSSPNGVMIASNGHLYGTTQTGGTGNAGTVFKIKGGQITVLHDFQTVDGANPGGTLTAGLDGKLYGVTIAGGTSGLGTIFSVDLLGNFTLVHSFSASEGSQPTAQLTVGPEGAFYGTTLTGGTNGVGTAFRLSLSGELTTLFSFGPTHGCPGTLTLDSDGNFYGITTDGESLNFENYNYYCPTRFGLGSLFRMSAAGTYTTLYEFSGNNCSEGCAPAAPVDSLLEASDGNLYGVSQEGGYGDACAGGTVFEFTRAQNVNWYSFPDNGIGNPCCGLVQDPEGVLRGVAAGGNCLSFGTVLSGGYELSLGLPKPKPVVTLLFPQNGKAGALVGVDGTNFIGVDSVTFNGTPAAFSVISASYMVAEVPSGATSGNIFFTSPGGVTESKQSFTVLP